jgi:hypothetical protein
MFKLSDKADSALSPKLGSSILKARTCGILKAEKERLMRTTSGLSKTVFFSFALGFQSTYAIVQQQQE